MLCVVARPVASTEAKWVHRMSTDKPSCTHWATVCDREGEGEEEERKGGEGGGGVTQT
jgi:hypothetical protein